MQVAAIVIQMMQAKGNIHKKPKNAGNRNQLHYKYAITTASPSPLVGAWAGQIEERWANKANTIIIQATNASGRGSCSYSLIPTLLRVGKLSATW